MKNALKKGILSTSYRDGTKSVSNPPAQSARLLQPNTQEETTLKVLQYIAASGVNTFGLYSVGTDLLLSGGLRLSELINGASLLVNNNGQVLIKGRKGSADKLVTPIYQREYWRGKVGWLPNPFTFASRWSWYRFFKAQGVVISEAGHVHNSVTHSARKLQAHQLFNAGVAETSVRDVVGHRSVRSTQFYRPIGRVDNGQSKQKQGNGKE